VYQLSEELADKIWNVVSEWDHFAKNTIGRQLIRAADSIGANIAEGHGKGSFLDNRRFVKIARGSMNETRHFLRRCHKRKLISSLAEQELKSILNNLAPGLNGYLKSIGQTE
jgi:four helix bundle protein